MQKGDRSQTESDGKSDPESGKVRGKTIRDALHDLKHGEPLRKVELAIEAGFLGLLGILVFVFVENSMDRPRVIVALLALAVIGGIVVLWIRVDRYFHTPISPDHDARPSISSVTAPTNPTDASNLLILAYTFGKPTYPGGVTLGTVAWSQRFSELRVSLFNHGNTPVTNVDLIIRPDEPVAPIEPARAGEISRIA